MTPVVVSKFWIEPSDDELASFRKSKAVFNVSTSGMDPDEEIAQRVTVRARLIDAGLRCVMRVVTCKIGRSGWAKSCNERQKYLMSLKPVIDNPLRPRPLNPRVLSGEKITERRADSVGG